MKEENKKKKKMPVNNNFPKREKLNN